MNKDTTMQIGDVAHVEYNTGEVFDGEIVKVHTMPDGRVLFTVHDESVGYRSMYVDKCVVCDILRLQPLN